MSQQTLDQQRASHAWTSFQKFLEWANAPAANRDEAKEKDEARKKYGVHVRKLSMRIMSSGLGQSLAFLVAKGKTPALLYALSDWCLYRRPKKSGNASEPNELLLAVVTGDSEFAQHMTAEVLAYTRWLTRFVEAAGLADVEEDA